MRIMVKEGAVKVIEASPVEQNIMLGWGKNAMHRPKARDCQLEGPATMETLDRLAELLGRSHKILPPDAEAERARLHERQAAIDRERMREDPEPLAHAPVKAKLYKHQIRGFNMCLLTFGWVDPKTPKAQCGV